jgi:hypothetical protein
MSFLTGLLDKLDTALEQLSGPPDEAMQEGADADPVPPPSALLG